MCLHPPHIHLPHRVAEVMALANAHPLLTDAVTSACAAAESCWGAVLQVDAVTMVTDTADASCIARVHGDITGGMAANSDLARRARRRPQQFVPLDLEMSRNVLDAKPLSLSSAKKKSAGNSMQATTRCSLVAGSLLEEL